MLKCIVLLGVLFLCSSARAVNFLEQILEVLNQASQIRGQSSDSCNVNLCFAIDGSDNLSPSQFGIEQDFVRGVVQDVSEDNEIGVAAVQFGIANRVISPLTEDVPAFLKALADSTFGDASRSFTGAGVVYCAGQLLGDSSRRRVMVVIGTGRTDIGGSPIARANLFKEEGGEVIAVGVGDTNSKNLNGIASGSKNVFSLSSASEIGNVVDDVVSEICG